MATGTDIAARGARVIFIPPPLYYVAGFVAGMLLNGAAGSRARISAADHRESAILETQGRIAARAFQDFRARRPARVQPARVGPKSANRGAWRALNVRDWLSPTPGHSPQPQVTPFPNRPAWAPGGPGRRSATPDPDAAGPPHTARRSPPRPRSASSRRR